MTWLQRSTHQKANHAVFSQSGICMFILQRARKLSFFVVVLLSILLSIFISQTFRSAHQQAPNLQPGHPFESANLHLLIPATKPDANLCKAILSASILGYSTPTIINWNADPQRADQVAGGTHLAKISGIHAYLAELAPHNDNDLVLIVDGYDAWLQLRPQTLIDRYFGIVRRADSRLAARFGGRAPAAIQQTVVFGGQKRCWPWGSSDPPCYAAEASDLPANVFGPGTDEMVSGAPNPYARVRPRFLNSGIAMGRVHALRKLFAHATQLAERESNFGSDQFVLSHIYGDQELWREVERRRTLGVLERIRERWSGVAAAPAEARADAFVGRDEHLCEAAAKAAETEDGNYEFGIGIDFRGELGLNTVFAEDETAWVSLEQLGANESSLDGVPGFSSDFIASLPPFWTFTHEAGVPRHASWTSVPLFTDLATGIAPAVIHHNAHRDGRKALRETWWNETWFFGHARTLYDASVYQPGVPIALSGYDSASMTEWWPRERFKGGAKEGRDGWLRFDDICKDYHEEVFRDGKGPWTLPENH